MNCITAKIAQEIGMLFKNQNFDTGTSKQISQHHAGWPTPCDAATYGNPLSRHFSTDAALLGYYKTTGIKSRFWKL
jgi:hypothetical protein